MKPETFHLELITPCFCAGANQAVAEIRAPSIRGQLRWWFRALGGSARDEALLFGSAAGESGAGSRMRLSVCNVKAPAPWAPPHYSPNDAQSYVWHYASVSGTTVKGDKGPRWQRHGALPVGTTWEIRLTWLRPAGDLKPAFDTALQAFLTLGTIGLRGTRGLGAFICQEATNLDSVIRSLTAKSFTVRRRTSPDSFSDYSSTLRDWAAWLRYRLRKDHKAERPSPLGSSVPRQTSAVRFRPFRTRDGNFSWLAYEAPANRVLGSDSSRNAPLLAHYQFSGLAPSPAPNGRRD
jgi:hypothetical protein